MKFFTTKKQRVLVWSLVAALVVTMTVPFMGQVASASVTGSDRNRESGSEYGFWDSSNWNENSTASPTVSASAVPSATTSGGGIVSPTPKPTKTPRPIRTPRPTRTPKPVVTAKPKADTYLKNTSDDIILTMGATGEFDIDRTEFASYHLENITTLRYSVTDSSILQVTADGAYHALKVGRTTLTLVGEDEEDDILERTYTVYVYPDMSGVTLSKDSVELYMMKNNYYGDSSVTIRIKGGDSSLFDEDENDDLVYQITSSNKKMYVSAEISDGNLILTCDDAGTTTVTFTLYGKEFKIQLKVSVVGISDTSALLVRHKTKKLRISGYKGKITWKSSRPKVASVSGTGKVRGKKEGNTIISAKIGGFKLGCLVSVTTTRKKKVIRCAQKIASTSQYSQPRRMQKGYYDCSSLVWRSYSKYGVRFGASSYAPTAAGLAEYMARRHKLLGGGFSQKNAVNLKFKAGDLMFETGASNGRYKGIYHVEMIIGYEFYGWDEKNKPIVAVKWANRPDGHYGYGAGIVGKV